MYQINAQHLQQAFADESLETTDGLIRFERHKIDDLAVLSGRIAACDPLVLDDSVAFEAVFPCGVFPVEVAIAHVNGDQRIAFARLLFSQKPIVRWSMALLSDEDINTLEQGEFFGYGVDAGTGCFMDINAARRYERLLDHDESYADKIIHGMDRTYQHTRSWLSFRPDETEFENIVCFSTGYGDGSYPTSIAYDADNQPVMLVTDFFVIPEASEAAA